MSDVHESECSIHKGWHGETRCAWCMQDEIERLRSLLREALDRALLDRMDGLLRSDVENWAERVREVLGNE